MDIKEQATILLNNGWALHASDVYIFPTKTAYDIFYRVYDVKKYVTTLSHQEGEKLILYFKYMADMDVAEKRRAQIGASDYQYAGRARRLRFSSVGNYQYYESLVIRFLHDLSQKDSDHYFFEQQYKQLQKQTIHRGLYLFSGPTGSGKTTTMYRLAKELEKAHKQVITIEDPVELEESYFLQLQTNKKIGLTYEELVKLCLRHRPDLLIVGEIRDKETAQAVIRGALTGHTIFSTIHASNIRGVWSRLLELGISVEELRQCLQGIVYQQLLPVCCPYCKDECSLHCSSKNEGVLFDMCFSKKEMEGEDAGKRKDWNQQLGKAKCYSFISERTYQKEKKKDL